MTKKSVTRYILGAMFALFLPLISYGQGGNLGSSSSPIINRYGQGIAGVNIAFCQPLSTTAATVTSNVAILTMSSNPITAGFVAGMTIQVAGFTGGDTYFNGGTFSGSSITGGYTILSVTTTTITYSLTHANASAGTNGTVLQMGNISTSCAGKSAVYSNPTLATTTTNPTVSDNQGNWNVFAVPGLYYGQFYGTGITTTLKQIAIACVPTGVCTAISPLVIAGATSGGLSLTSPAVGGAAALQLGVIGNGTAQATFPAVNDIVVELTQVQSLSNKTLPSPIISTPTVTGLSTTGASSGDNITQLNFQGPLTPVTGNGAAQTYYTYTLPANVMALGKGIKITVVSKHGTGSASANMSLSFGGTSTTVMGDDTTSTAATTKIEYYVLNNGSTSAQIIDSTLLRRLAGTVFGRFDTASVSTTAGVTINAQFNVANTDALTPELFLVELIQ